MREAAVDFVGVFATSLVETAVEEDAFSIYFEKVLGAGGGASSTTKFEFH